MKLYSILISALMLSSLSTLFAEPDRELRDFLQITSVESKIKVEAEAHYFEIVVFREGRQIAILPMAMTFDPTPNHREMQANLMFNDKGLVKFICGGAVNNLSHNLNWKEILKSTGGKMFKKGSSDKPVGVMGGAKVVSMVNVEQRNTGDPKFQIQTELKMDESIKLAIENAKASVLVVFKSGTQVEIEKAWSESVEANKKRVEHDKRS